MIHGGRTIRASAAFAIWAAVAGACQTRSTPRVDVKPAVIERLGPEIERAAGEGVDALAAHFDWEEFAQRSAPPGLSLPEREAFLRGVRQSLGTDGGGLLTAIGGGAFTYRGIAWRDGRPVARFRFLPAAGGFNFHDLVIARRADGSYRVVDMFVMTSSEYLTESMRRIAAFLLGDTSSLATRIFGDRGVTPEEMEAVRAFNQLAAGPDPEAALRAYDALTPRVRGQRSVRLMRVQVASRLEDDARYLAILNETAVNLPGDPALSSMMLDAHFLEQDWAGCLADLGAIRAVYPDPYVDAFEGRIRVQAGEAEAALAIAERVIAADGSLIDGHDVALLAALRLGRTDRARQALDRLVADHGVDPVALAALPGYDGVLALTATP